MINVRARRTLAASTLVVSLTALLISCSGGSDTASSDTSSPSRGIRTTAPATTAGEPSAATTTAPAQAPEKVRDAFAGLQATYNDGCTTPGNCEYFLGRLHDELARLDKAMRADPQGPGHFKEPLAWLAKLLHEVGDDTSFDNLKKHQDQLTGTRDKINAWMQGHPEDYR
ncbi:hypothetical protein [Streptomyces malaysiense]|uniref:Lipoprotein n=1 Tax=Streptomyces malaysiense TaxID=1428626 RepID=A0A1J4PYP4_9ACTN|nr:hypothetical protein [Streptomyces malaysiense]OIK26059.1 hypothetical protein VT52_018790 [Streptomyces malaysiense]